MKPIEKHHRFAAQPAPFRRTLLASACVMAFASQAQASPAPTLGIAYSATSSDASLVYVGGYSLSLTNPQSVTANVSGTVEGGTVQITTTSGTSSSTVAGNAATTTATGNRATNEIDLKALVNSGNPGGIALGSGQTVSGGAGSVAVTALTSDKIFSVAQTNAGSVPVTLQGNSATATTTLNTATNVVSGSTPQVYASTQTGFVAMTAGATAGTGDATDSTALVYGARGSIAMTNVQSAFNAGADAGSQAKVDSSAVAAYVGGSGTQTGAITASGNTMAARYNANTATTVYSADAASGAFTGSVVVGNSQTSIDAAQGTAPTARVSNAGVLISANNPDQINEGALTISSNTVSATSTGNAAGAVDASGRILAGNAIVIDSQRAVTGSGTGAAIQANAGLGIGAAAADLAVANAQINSTTAFRSEAQNVSVATDSAVIQGTAGGISISDNRLSAAATGNLAGNLVAVTAPSFSGTSAIGSAQGNYSSSVTALVSTAAIDGKAAGVDTSSISVSGNGITAQATGSTAANTVAVQATSVDLPGVQVANSQENGGTAVSMSSRVANATIYARPADVVTGTTSLDTASLSVTSNTIAAGTTGNAAANTIALSGTAGSITGFVVNGQANLSLANLKSEVDGARIVAKTAYDATDSSLTVADNRIAASTTGNTASTSIGARFDNLTVTNPTNAVNDQAQMGGTVSASVAGADVRALSYGAIDQSGLSVSGSTLTVGGNTVAAQAAGNVVTQRIAIDATNLTASGSAGAMAATATSGSVDVTGAGGDLNVINKQRTTSALSATVQATQGITLSRVDTNDGLVGTGVARSALTVSGNTTSAIAQSQSATNALSINATNLGTSGGQVTGAVANAQSTSGAVTAMQTTLPLDDTTKASYAIIADSVSSTVSKTSSVSVADNRITVAGGQNQAVNELSASGTALNSAASTVAFQVLNAQSGSGGVTASSLPGVIGVQMGSLNGNVSVANNAVMVLASVNTAVNGLKLEAGSALQGGGVVGSTQDASGDVSATIGKASGAEPIVVGVYPVAGGLTGLSGSTASVAGNSLVAQGAANTASNSLSASAVTGIASASGSTAMFNQTYQVLNGQSSSSAVSTGVYGASIGLYAAAGLTGTPVSVTGNMVSASSSGNTASNTLVTSMLPATANASTALLNNVQSNSGAISATASGVTIGSTGVGGSASPAVVSGNTIAASAVGNSAVNRLLSK